MKFEIKNPALFVAKFEQISKFLSHVGVSFYKGKISISGMNSMNTLLLSLELGEKALVGYTFVKSDSYAFNVSAFLNAINDAKSLKFEFKAGLLTITTNNSEAILPTIKLRRSEEQKLDFNANFDISPYLHLFKECRIKAKSIFPIQLEGDIGEGMMLKVVASPTISATRLGNYEYPANI